MNNNSPTNREMVLITIGFLAYLGLIWLCDKLRSWLLFCLFCIITTAIATALLIPTKRVVKYITIIYDGDKPVEVKEIEREVK